MMRHQPPGLFKDRRKRAQLDAAGADKPLQNPASLSTLQRTRADLSRSWKIDHTAMSDGQRRIYSAAIEQIRHNAELIELRMESREYVERAWIIPEQYVANRYVGALHGVGMSDEYPVMPNGPEIASLVEGGFAEGMVFCVESLIGEEHAGECVNPETRVVVTASGARRLDSFPLGGGLANCPRACG